MRKSLRTVLAEDDTSSGIRPGVPPSNARRYGYLPQSGGFGRGWGPHLALRATFPVRGEGFGRAGEDGLLCDVDGRPLSVASRHLSPPRGRGKRRATAKVAPTEETEDIIQRKRSPFVILSIREGSRRRLVGCIKASRETDPTPGARSFDLLRSLRMTRREAERFGDCSLRGRNGIRARRRARVLPHGWT